MNKNRVHSHIKKLKEGHTKIEDIQREARAYFGGEEHINNINRPQNQKVNSDRQRQLDALQEDGRILPERRRDELSVSSPFEVWNVQYAIEEIRSGKMVGEDGIPAEWYKTMGARVTKSVYEDEIDMDATPMEGLYPSALAHLISNAYTETE